MNKQALRKFIDKYPYHFLCTYLNTLIQATTPDIDMTTYEMVHEVYLIAIRNNKLTAQEKEQIEILLTNIVEHG